LFTVDRIQILEAARRDGLRLQKTALDLPMTGDLPQNWFEQLRSRAQRVVEVFRAQPDVAGHPVAGTTLPDELLSLYLRSARGMGLCESEDRCDFQDGASVVRLAEDWLRANPSPVVSIDHLCKALRYSQRSLYRAFQSELGISPARKLKLYCLSRPRHQLTSAEPKQTTVAEIGLRWGFWELGRFGREYRTMFGELPSETLRKRWSD